MRYLSVCSGIEAASVAWHPLGWVPAAFSEIVAFPRAVLTARWPSVPLHGDFTTISGTEYGSTDLLVGGTPCQSFSVAGLRRGMAGERGNLALEFLRLAARTGARWLVWENVPGVLSSNGGRDFGAFLGGLVELGYGFAYRVLDAQYVRVDGYARAVPQRRRRVFVVGHLGDWRRPAAVLFERESLSGHPAPRREARERIAPTVSTGTRGSGDFELAGGLVPRVSPALKARDFKGPSSDGDGDGDGDGAPLLAVASVFDPRQITNITNKDHRGGTRSDRSHSLHEHAPAIAFQCHGSNVGEMGTLAGPVMATYHKTLNRAGKEAGRIDNHTIQNMAVRRLTPRECERLQGFPDDYTLVPNRGKPAADGPRYKALGNSMAVNCMRWIGRRIAAVEGL